MRHSIMRCCAVLLAGLAAGAIASPTPSQAQVPPGFECACLSLAVEALGADLAAKRQAYEGMQGELGQLDNQLQGERSRMDVNNPFNFVRWNNPNTSITSADYGRVTGSAEGRKVQLYLAVQF